MLGNIIKLRWDVTDAGQTTNEQPITEDRATQPMEAGGWVSQIVHGAEAEFLLIVQNNIQKPGGKNSAQTAGKDMVACQGSLKEQLFSTGIKFGDDFVMIANDHDMQITES